MFIVLKPEVNEKFRKQLNGNLKSVFKSQMTGSIPLAQVRLWTILALETEQSWNSQRNKLILTEVRPSETNSQKLHKERVSEDSVKQTSREGIN